MSVTSSPRSSSRRNLDHAFPPFAAGLPSVYERAGFEVAPHTRSRSRSPSLSGSFSSSSSRKGHIVGNYAGSLTSLSGSTHSTPPPGLYSKSEPELKLAVPSSLSSTENSASVNHSESPRPLPPPIPEIIAEEYAGEAAENEEQDEIDDAAPLPPAHGSGSGSQLAQEKQQEAESSRWNDVPGTPGFKPGFEAPLSSMSTDSMADRMVYPRDEAIADDNEAIMGSHENPAVAEESEFEGAEDNEEDELAEELELDEPLTSSRASTEQITAADSRSASRVATEAAGIKERDPSSTEPRNGRPLVNVDGYVDGHASVYSQSRVSTIASMSTQQYEDAEMDFEDHNDTVAPPARQLASSSPKSMESPADRSQESLDFGQEPTPVMTQSARPTLQINPYAVPPVDSEEPEPESRPLPSQPNPYATTNAKTQATSPSNVHGLGIEGDDTPRPPAQADDSETRQIDLPQQQASHLAQQPQNVYPHTQGFSSLSAKGASKPFAYGPGPHQNARPYRPGPLQNQSAQIPNPYGFARSPTSPTSPMMGGHMPQGYRPGMPRAANNYANSPQQQMRLRADPTEDYPAKSRSPQPFGALGSFPGDGIPMGAPKRFPSHGVATSVQRPGQPQAGGIGPGAGLMHGSSHGHAPVARGPNGFLSNRQFASSPGWQQPLPGMPMPGMPMPGMPMRGMPTPGMPMPGMPMPGMPMPGMPMPGMPMPGMPLPGMPTPGMPMPGMPMPGATMPRMTRPLGGQPDRGQQLGGFPTHGAMNRHPMTDSAEHNGNQPAREAPEHLSRSGADADVSRHAQMPRPTAAGYSSESSPNLSHSQGNSLASSASSDLDFGDAPPSTKPLNIKASTPGFLEVPGRMRRNSASSSIYSARRSAMPPAASAENTGQSPGHFTEPSDGSGVSFDFSQAALKVSAPSRQMRSGRSSQDSLDLASGDDGMISADATQSSFASQGGRQRRQCRGCLLPIMGKSVRSKDGSLTGRWHRDCFRCTRCDDPLTGAERTHVLEDQPFCPGCYHVVAKTTCRTCGEGIEGSCLETRGETEGNHPVMYHVDCLRCADCQMRLHQSYFEVDGATYCAEHAFSSLPQNTEVHKRYTQFMMI